MKLTSKQKNEIKQTFTVMVNSQLSGLFKGAYGVSFGADTVFVAKKQVAVFGRAYYPINTNQSVIEDQFKKLLSKFEGSVVRTKTRFFEDSLWSKKLSGNGGSGVPGRGSSENKYEHSDAVQLQMEIVFDAEEEFAPFTEGNTGIKFKELITVESKQDDLAALKDVHSKCAPKGDDFDEFLKDTMQFLTDEEIKLTAYTKVWDFLANTQFKHGYKNPAELATAFVNWMKSAKPTVTESTIAEAVERNDFKGIDGDVTQDLEDGYYKFAEGLSKVIESLKSAAKTNPKFAEELKMYESAKKATDKSALGKYL